MDSQPETPISDLDYLEDMGEPIPIVTMARYAAVDLSPYQFPRYLKPDFHEMVFGIRYEGLVKDSDHLQNEMNQEPLSRDIIDAACKHFEQGKELEGKKIMLQNAFDQRFEPKSEEAWKRKSEKYPNVNCMALPENCDDENLIGYQNHFAALLENPGENLDSVFAIEEIEYWAKKLTPKTWRESLEVLRKSGWMEFKANEKKQKDINARALAENREAFSKMSLDG